jgi:shikimate dehydrogenase
LKINAKTKVYGVIGDPIEHSLSPIIHNAAFKKLKLNAVYLAFKVSPTNLADAVKGLKSLGVSGFNVTIPHKISIIPLLDEVDSLAEKIGAVNTVKNVDGKLVGYNTDGEGALKALEENGVSLKNKKIVLVGAGGASKALAFTFANYAEELIILNRTEEKAINLAASISKNYGLKVKGLRLNEENLALELKDADILVNTTSVGMYPNIKETPIPKKLIKPGMVVFDIVYKPLKTRLLRDAKLKGAKVVDGLAMLVYQAVKAFEIWTGLHPPVNVMFKAALRGLKG